MNNDGKMPKDVLVLRLTRDPWRLEIGGTMQDIDLCIAVVNQAKRHFETQSQIAAMLQQAQMQASMSEQAALSQSIFTGGKRQ